MRRWIAILLLMATPCFGQDVRFISFTDNMGLWWTNWNYNFSNLLAQVTNAFNVPPVEKSSNVNYVGVSPTNVHQLDYCFTNGSGSSISLVELSNSVTAVGLTATSAASQASWKGTNLFPLAFGAGNTATILRADTLLGRPFKADLTSTPASITFEAGWPTNEIGDAFVSFFKGTNSLTMVGATIIDSGRASSTNVDLSSTNRTEVLFHKALGESKFNVIQLVP